MSYEAGHDARVQTADVSRELCIHALHVGDIIDWPTPALIHMRGFQEIRDIPLIMFVITGGPSPIVVDTGGASPAEVADVHGYTMRQSEQQRPEVVLSSLGIDPLDVRLVVNSHLHWDHSSNNHLFPNARIVVQESELAYALDPEQPHRKPYEQLGQREPRWQSGRDRFDIVRGDVQIAPGVRVIHLPGHSPGSQGVLVSTTSGRFLITGDCVGSYENWKGDDFVDHFPSGTFTSLPEYMSSFRRIEELDCTVIPSHDFEVVAEGIFT
ncbi:MAG: putative hydrolase [Microbacteriaceae bacterium]|jgi:N-acyl homoserine lactone hydrolase|nr:putative hydrolase [Microbacteriaceae bacterium]